MKKNQFFLNKAGYHIVNHIVTLLERLSTLTGVGKAHLWSKILALMTDLASENHFLAIEIAEHLQLDVIPGMLWCVLHTCLGFDRNCLYSTRTWSQTLGKIS